jgi:hypothetical protein
VPTFKDEAELVTSDVHAVEVSVQIETFNFLALELDLSQCHLVGVTAQITKESEWLSFCLSAKESGPL